MISINCRKSTRNKLKKKILKAHGECNVTGECLGFALCTLMEFLWAEARESER